ncbi:folate-binding protein YgfZ [Polynucleobacter sp. MWH-UH35A]|uniref:CAF17-like 4Fe-4S cluster assembly/insertion protein YgfZ n=1 Tax=Polynucleobacter sp. MWH-UH35A TaxID=1855619 RepID=UPI001BFD5D89|nr:folate-binding protein [Polynucleobacter sp. MWH-UH35A]QWD61021.1 folate-binding protein YgfZ [Polynucleobacter sp. MWH-UH35A]
MNNSPQIQPNWPSNPSSLPCELLEWGLIVIEGSDAASFLQNQLTNSVLGLERTLPGRVAQEYSGTHLVGYCSPKGRLLASAWLGLFPTGADAQDRFVLFISKDIAASTAKRLSMYVLRSKVKVTDLSNDLSISGLYCSEEQLLDVKPNPDGINLRLPNVLVGSQSVARLLMAVAKNNQASSDKSSEQLSVWNDLEVLSGIPRIVQATQEQFVPQMINFESVAGVDFKKGCYPGQEIVARSQYRGAIKRRLQLAHVTNARSILPGTELFHSTDPGQPAGMVVLSAQSPYDLSRTDLQIECKLEALEAGEIHLGSTDGPVLKIDSLPYRLLDI